MKPVKKNVINPVKKPDNKNVILQKTAVKLESKIANKNVTKGPINIENKITHNTDNNKESDENNKNIMDDNLKEELDKIKSTKINNVEDFISVHEQISVLNVLTFKKFKLINEILIKLMKNLNLSIDNNLKIVQ